MEVSKLNLNDITVNQLKNLKENVEASEYEGCSYDFNSLRIVQRVAKVTPKKNGQFVTLWKRNRDNVTCPLDFKDNFDYVVIICRTSASSGHFLFSKRVLLEKNIISSSDKLKSGKRGFRVYPKWDKPKSKQAMDTQAWQIEYFSRSLILQI